MNTRATLSLNSVTNPISLPQCGTPVIPRKTLADPAMDVMTDFTNTPAFSIGHNEPIDHALLYMKTVGVRLLFALDDNGNLTGLITSSDIQGEKPMLYLQSIDCNHMTCTRSDILVRNIMTPVSHWEVINYTDAKKAQISQIISAFRSTGLKHLVVIGKSESCPESIVRGLFSASRIEQATSLQLDIVSTPRNFAEIEHAITHS
jgi:CBS-domain-containing membrane protein